MIPITEPTPQIAPRPVSQARVASRLTAVATSMGLLSAPWVGALWWPSDVAVLVAAASYLFLVPGFFAVVTIGHGRGRPRTTEGRW